ncbi:LysR substrate binding domain [Serratia ficaria]|nr:LysR substrate binding domain [Serratia ficaria]
MTAALGGMGMVLFPDWLIGDSIKKGELVRLMPHYQAAINTEPLQIAAIYPHARHPPLNVRAVIDYFVEVYGAPLYWQFD